MSDRVRRVAVLGGSRFIGRAIVEALLANGWRVTTVNRGNTPVNYAHPVVHVAADRSDPAGYARALAGIDADAVVDVTAYHPGDTRVACDAFRGRLKCFVHISTLSVYRWPLPGPLAEAAPLETDTRNAYGFDKAACERLLFDEPTAGLPWTVLRLPAVFGPGDPCSREAFLYRQIVEEKAIVVPPRPYRCQNLFVADAARAVLRLLESPQAVGRAYNAGGLPFTLEAYLELLAQRAGQAPRMMRADGGVLAQGGADPRKIPYYYEGDLVLDTRRIRQEIGFAPAWELAPALAATLAAIERAPDPAAADAWGLPWQK
jgi:nucleoside-diphosphate-sugar epimerase